MLRKRPLMPQGLAETGYSSDDKNNLTATYRRHRVRPQAMGRNWAIAIGINEYYNLQPLNFAKRDAEQIRQFFLRNVGFEAVYLFSDDSPPISQDFGPTIASQPTYATLRRFLRVRFEQSFLTSGDNFWFFFAGHGIRHEDRDYLMPLDADPGDIDGTAIPLSYVAERLRRCGADNVVLLIDACRSQGRRDGLGIGNEPQQGVITIFSCSPKESSYEIEALGQGAFTHSLLQAMQIQGEGNCATVERLYQYLRYRVPLINRQYNKPNQTPYAIVEPATKYHLILLPRFANVRDAETLKLDAFKAENAKDFTLAEQLWIRVWIVSPADPDAIEGIRRVDRLKTSSSQTSSSSPTDSSGDRQPNQSQESLSPVTPLPPPSVSPLPQARSASNQQPVSPQPPRPNSLLSEKRTTSTVGSPSRQTQAWPLEFLELLELPINRRRFLQIAGGLGFLIVASALGRGLWRRDSPNIPGFEPETKTDSTIEFSVVSVTPTGDIANVERKSANYRTEDLGNGVLLDMISIPAGTFTMGSPFEEKERNEDEGPQRDVSVSVFEMGKYAVTQAQWRAVAALPRVNRDLNATPSRFQGNNLPVETVSWREAVEFCDRLSQKTGKTYRLPSEAEWEYACRAGASTPFYFGETITPDLANYNGNYTYGSGPKGIYREKTTDVGTFPPNSFGLFDMHGNVYEWCLDYWHENYQGAPTDGSAWTEGGDNSTRLLRGGSWYINPRNCRSAYRGRIDTDDKNYVIGFRVVCSAPRALS